MLLRHALPAACADGAPRMPRPLLGDPVVAVACESHNLHFGDGGGGASACASVVFMLAGPACKDPATAVATPASPPSAPPWKQTQSPQHHARAAEQPPRVVWQGRTRIELCSSEVQLLARWRDWFLGADPDCVATFQVRHCSSRTAPAFPP